MQNYVPTWTANDRLECTSEECGPTVDLRIGCVTESPLKTPINRAFIHNSQVSEISKQIHRTVPTGKLLLYTATRLDLHDHNLVKILYQASQNKPGPLQLHRRFEM